jgi:hypothetical protein
MKRPGLSLAVMALAAGLLLTVAPGVNAADGDDLEYVDIEALLKEDEAPARAPEPKTEAQMLEDFVNIEDLLRDDDDRAEATRLQAGEKGRSAPSPQAIQGELQALRKKVINVNRDLSTMERDLLYPVSSQVSVFISLDAGQLFVPDSIALKVNDRLVASHLYTEREVTALQRGGIQRLFTGNVRKGDHEMIAVLTGKGPKGKPYRRAVSVIFDKEASAKYLELKIQGSRERQEPLFEFSEWE